MNIAFSPSQRLSQKRAEALLASVIMARSTSFLMSELLLRSMTAQDLLALRFGLAFLFLLPLFSKRILRASRREVLKGLLLGLLFSLVMFAELAALKFPGASSRVALLENSAVVWVPLFSALLLRKRPARPALSGALLALAGIAGLTLKGPAASLEVGDLFGLLSSFFYTIAIIAAHRLTQEDSALTIGLFQVLGMALCSSAVCLFTGAPALPSGAFQWGALLWQALVCTGFGFTLQPFAQSGTTAERAGLLCALSPLSAALLGRVFMNERLGLQGLIGGCLIMAGILLPQIISHPHRD